MAAAEVTIEVKAGTELDRLLTEAVDRRLVLVKDGIRYRVEREAAEDDLWAHYDPQRVLQALADTAGSWQEIDTAALITELYDQRGQDSRGRPND